VRLRLTPKETSFYDLFAQAADNLVVGAALLAELLGADKAERVVIAERMRDAEHASDEITHGIYRQLNSSFITPFDREDIYKLASLLDDVMDEMDAAADLVSLYQIDALPAGVADQVDVLVRAADLTAEAMPRLRTMKDLQDYWIEINRLENQADQIHRKLLAQLFNGKYDAMEVLKLKQIVDVLEEAADAFEHVANTVETIAVKES
jgi:predicted phosphate transport protein (TIGR00153 family)